MPEHLAFYCAAIVLIWYLDRVARNDRRKASRVFRMGTPPPNATCLSW